MSTLTKEFFRNFRDAITRGTTLEAPTINVFRLEWPFERQPADRSRDVVSSAKDTTINEYARADSCPDGDEDGIATTACRPLPGFAMDRRRAIAINNHLNV